MPKLRVLAGPSPSQLSAISVNTSQAHAISSEIFEGKVVVHIKGFNEGEDEDTPKPDNYFEREDRQWITWSIQVQGRFLREYGADNILFGNTFDRPLKLPWGTSAVLRFMNYIDPTLQHDLQSTTKPWALAPLISTMPYLAHRKLEKGNESIEHWPEFPGNDSLVDDVSQIHLAARALPQNDDYGNCNEDLEEELKSVHSPHERRTYFGAAEKRKEVILGPSDLITTDFCYGFLTFSGGGGGPRLEIPGGLSFDLGRYWDGQPVRFVCCERKSPTEDTDGEPWGRIFWCVVIVLDEEEDSEPDMDDEDASNQEGKGSLDID